MKGRVLIIAGSDPSGGAGIQADIKTVTALGGYAATAITALTVQNTKGVGAVHPVAPDLIRAQIDAVMDDIGADAIKIGMIGDVPTARLIASFMRKASRKAIPIVLDPVLIATSGDALAADGVAGVIKDELLSLVTIATPNSDELAALSGAPAPSTNDELLALGKSLHESTGKALLIKGGHIEDGEAVVDFLIDRGEISAFRNARIKTTSTHGTGCTLASAVATGLAQGMSLSSAVARAVAYVHEAIKAAPGFGKGNGPLNHGFAISPD